MRGPSGAGKSDLALRLITMGATLIADDQVRLTTEASVLYASPPDAIAGLIELRGVGIRRLPYRHRVAVALVVDLVQPEAVERLPDAREVELDGVKVPTLALAAFETSAAVKVAYAMQAEGAPGAAGAPPTIGCKETGMGESRTSLRAAGKIAAAEKARVLLITGMSGAGRSTALKLLEDMGYEAVDNLPLSLLPGLVGSCGERQHPIAVGIDIRTRDFAVKSVFGELDNLIGHGGLDSRLVFLECDDEVLARRYTETRRRHPLAGDRPVIDGIRRERDLVSPLRDRADLVIDTSSLHRADLKRLLVGNFGLDDRTDLQLFVTSFSYREGLPREADLVFDVRFLDNPYYQPQLKMQTGLDPEVAEFVAADRSWAGFFGSLTALLSTLLPSYDREGKSYLTIAVGCTGGRHRSVFTAERLARWLEGSGYAVSVAHRDIELSPNPNTEHFPGTAPRAVAP